MTDTNNPKAEGETPKQTMERLTREFNAMSIFERAIFMKKICTPAPAHTEAAPRHKPRKFRLDADESSAEEAASVDELAALSEELRYRIDCSEDGFSKVPRHVLVKVRDLLRAAASSAEGAVPAGFKLVPIEPTEDMAKAYLNPSMASWRQRYLAMLDAAPAAPLAARQEPVDEQVAFEVFFDHHIDATDTIDRAWLFRIIKRWQSVFTPAGIGKELTPNQFAAIRAGAAALRKIGDYATFGPVLDNLLAAPHAADSAPLTREDVERQYKDGIDIGTGLPRATCPCGFCAKHRFGFNSGDGHAIPASAGSLADSAAQTSVSLDNEQIDKVFQRHAPVWHDRNPEVCRLIARELLAAPAGEVQP